MPTPELAELVRFTANNRVKKVELIGSGKNTRVQQLYDAILSENFRGDEAYARHLFGDNPRRIAYLRRVERQLSEQLHTTVFLLDNNKLESEGQVIFYDCLKYFAAYWILVGRGSERAAMQLAERTIKQALLLADLSEMIYLLSARLSKKYRASNRKYRYYLNLTEEFEQLVRGEVLASKYSNIIYREKHKSLSNLSKLKGQIEQYVKDLEPFMNIRVSHALAYDYFKFRVELKQLELDYDAVIDECDEALRVIRETTKYPRYVYIYHFQRAKLDALTKLKRKEEGEIAVQKCLQLIRQGTPIWFDTQFHVCIYYFHTGQYQLAYEHYAEMVQHPTNKYMATIVVENINLIGGYVHYLIAIGQVQDVHSIGKKFSIGKLINDTPIYSKDKRGHNITILVLQILFLLQRKKYGEVLDKMDALNMYCHRYLRKGHTFRSNCFIKMFLEIPKGYFNRTAATRKAQRYVDRLTNAPFKKTLEGADMEVIPYEELWQFALSTIDP